MQIYRGLTFNNGMREVNVHSVVGNIVYWGAHASGNDETGSLHKSTIDEFKRLAERSLENENVTCYTLINA